MENVFIIIVLLIAGYSCEKSAKGEEGLSFWARMIPAVLFWLCSMTLAIGTVLNIANCL